MKVIRITTISFQLRVSYTWHLLSGQGQMCQICYVYIHPYTYVYVYIFIIRLFQNNFSIHFIFIYWYIFINSQYRTLAERIIDLTLILISQNG